MAKKRGTAGKTLIGKSLRAMFFGSQREFDTLTKGMQGERQIGKALAKLPEGWHVWHDLDLSGENIDHVVASAKGVFIIEVKNYKNPVLALPSGIYTHGNKKPNSKVTSQVWRQVYKLNEHLEGQRVQPLLVFLNGVKAKDGYEGIPLCRKIPCLNLEQLVPYLRERENVLAYADAKRLFDILDGLTK